MSYSDTSNTPRGDPLAGWKQENLAAPKSTAGQQDYGYQATVYDDRSPAPAQAPNPAPSPPASSDLLTGCQEHNLATPQQAPEAAQSYQTTVYDESLPMMDPQNDPNLSLAPLPGSTPQSTGGAIKQGITDAEKSACPNGDTRWPPPKTSHPKPLQLLPDDKGSQRIYYHLIHKNTAPETKFWKKEIQLKSHTFFAQKFPFREEPRTTFNKSPEEIEEAREQAEFEEKGRLRNAVISAKLQKKLRDVSSGARGTVWLLEEESVEVWRCIEILQKGDVNKAVRIGAVVERFEIFGVGLKGEKDHVLLLSQKVG